MLSEIRQSQEDTHCMTLGPQVLESCQVHREKSTEWWWPGAGDGGEWGAVSWPQSSSFAKTKNSGDGW